MRIDRMAICALVLPMGLVVPLAEAQTFAKGQIASPSSNTNFASGLTRANNAVVAPGLGGKMSVLAGMASGQVDLLVDVVGYFE
jgi:hypothetical protein